VESHGGDDDAGWGKLLPHPPELSGNATSSHLGASRRNGRSENFAYQYLKYVKGLTCCKLLRNGISGFTSPPKKGVLRIFIALKIHRLGRV
jgi:hypothetical protein